MRSICGCRSATRSARASWNWPLRQRFSAAPQGVAGDRAGALAGASRPVRSCALGAPVPAGQMLLHLYRLGVAQGWGDEDISAIAKVLEHLSPKE